MEHGAVVGAPRQSTGMVDVTTAGWVTVAGPSGRI
jgi:hypothetical protein